MDAEDLQDLNIQQREMLLNFLEITQLQDHNLCRSILVQNNWNLETSLENFIHGGGGGGGGGGRGSGGEGRRQPSSDVLTTNHGASNSPTSTATIFDFVISPLRWIFRIYPESLHPDEDATQFISEFRREYGENGPDFQGASYSQVVSNANQQSKFLLVYLHSPLHDDTGKFCRFNSLPLFSTEKSSRQVLCSERITRILNGNEMLVWGGSVWDPEPYNLSLQLKVSTFPFLALLLCESERSVQILDRIQGLLWSHCTYLDFAFFRSD
jgi:hypothetical protein